MGASNVLLEKQRETHIVEKKVPWNVYRACNIRNTAIQKLQNLIRIHTCPNFVSGKSYIS